MKCQTSFLIFEGKIRDISEGYLLIFLPSTQNFTYLYDE